VTLAMPSRRNKTVTLIVGGARSGKSRYAQKLAEGFERVAFIATARASDSGMRRKIARHRLERPASWQTVEVPLRLESAIQSRSTTADVLIIDCLTLYLDNLMRAKRREESILEHFSQVCQAIRRAKSSIVVVSNEVGCGIVPAFRSGRIYRDLLGQLNQQIAQIADRVVLMVAGVPVTVWDKLAAERLDMLKGSIFEN
jgi:adenosylcobinamide kinase / adenosylcobinamide-phosphate guanylyltransferase